LIALFAVIAWTRTLAILIFNDGDRSGTVSQGLLKTPDGHAMGLTLASNNGVELIPPKSSLLVNYIIEGTMSPPPDANATCKIALIVSDKNGLKSFDVRTYGVGTFLVFFIISRLVRMVSRGRSSNV
jgi:hypothetical protein